MVWQRAPSADYISQIRMFWARPLNAMNVIVQYTWTALQNLSLIQICSCLVTRWAKTRECLTDAEAGLGEAHGVSRGNVSCGERGFQFSPLLHLTASVRNMHKYPLFILGIYTNYSFMFLLSSYLRLLFLVNSFLCLEWYSWIVTIYLHKLVKGNLVKRATEHQTPAEFQYTSTLGSTLLKHLQVATITLRLRPRPSGIQK